MALTAKELENELLNSSLSGAIKGLLDEGNLVIHDEPERIAGLPADAKALTTASGLMVLFPSRINPSCATPVFLHGAFHNSSRTLIDSKPWKRVLKQLDRLYSQAASTPGTVNRIWVESMVRVANDDDLNADASRDRQVEEFGAYAIELESSAPGSLRRWANRAKGVVQSWALETFNAQLGRVTPEQLSAMTKAAIRDQGKMATLRNSTFAVDSMSLASNRTARHRQLLLEGTAFSRVFHGTTADIQDLDLSAVGTNTGQLAYGWGVYFSESQTIAELYAKGRASEHVNSPNDRRVSHTVKHLLLDALESGGTEGLESATERVVGDLEMFGYERETITRVLEYSEQLRQPSVKLLAADIDISDRFLDWDGPIEGQHQFVQSAAREFSHRGITSASRGKELYTTIVDEFQRLGSSYPQRKASEMLLGYGIPGCQYNDYLLVKMGEPGRGYVVWDTSVIGSQQVMEQQYRLSNMPTPPNEAMPLQQALFSKTFHCAEKKYSNFDLDAMGYGPSINEFGWGAPLPSKTALDNAYQQLSDSGSTTEARILSWDLALSDQHPEVLARLDIQTRQLEIAEVDGAWVIKDSVTGEDLSTSFASESTAQRMASLMESDKLSITGKEYYLQKTHELGGKEAASKHLASLGLVGLQYLDRDEARASSANAERFIIWDDRLLQAISRKTPPRHAVTVDGALKPGPRELATCRNELEVESLKRSWLSADFCLRGVKGTILGNSIAREFYDRSGTSLVGHEINSPEDFAVLGQIYRNPSFETMRYVFTRGNTVVHAEGITSRLAGTSAAFPDKIAAMGRGPSWIKAIMMNVGADGVYCCHNHPSGNPTPSEPDIQLTQILASEVPGFKGHLIVNHETYSYIDQSMAVHKNLRLPKESIASNDAAIDTQPTKPHHLLNYHVTTIDDMAMLTRRFTDTENLALVGIANSGAVNLIAEIDEKTIADKTPVELGAILKKLAEQSNSTEISVINAPADNDKLHSLLVSGINHGFLFEAVTLDGRMLRQEMRGFYNAFQFGRERNKAYRVNEGGESFTYGYHGSPFLFDKLSLDNIGTGEGALAYGYGLYFAEEEEVAKWYQSVLQHSSMSINGKIIPNISGGHPDIDYVCDLLKVDFGLEDKDAHRLGLMLVSSRSVEGALKRMESDAEEYKLIGADAAVDHVNALKNVLANLDIHVMDRGTGNIYKAALPEKDGMLDWDNSLRDQSEKVKSALANMPTSILAEVKGMVRVALTRIDSSAAASNVTGKQLYHALHDVFATDPLSQAEGKMEIDALRNASFMLKDLGIPGLKYLDGASAGRAALPQDAPNAGHSNQNFVVWNINGIRIESVNNQTLQAARGKAQSVALQGHELQEWAKDSLVRDPAGQPLIVYRGEHGSAPVYQHGIHAREGSISFASLETAVSYALTPNDPSDTALSPRVIPAILNITNPVINDPDDPFIDFSVLAHALGIPAAIQVAIKASEHIYNTANWDEMCQDFDTVEELLNECPEAINGLYCDAYPILADPENVKLLRMRGFDGAIHCGNGISSEDVEYKVFSADQVMQVSNTITSVPSLTPVAQSDSIPQQRYLEGRVNSQFVGSDGVYDLFINKEGAGTIIARFGDKVEDEMSLSIPQAQRLFALGGLASHFSKGLAHYEAMVSNESKPKPFSPPRGQQSKTNTLQPGIRT